ncbi:MAG: hypothetical protein JKY15_06130, partial [Deltaproteobacteria bacterium]|nr:hypothetical protein [Deltaproteobacteria bacterium]
MLESFEDKVPDVPSKAEPYKLPEGDGRFVFDALNATADARDLPDAADGTRPIPDPLAKRFVHSPRGDIDESSWNDWRWQQRKRYRNIKDLEGVIKVTEDEKRAFSESDAMFHMGITPYYGALMDPDDPKCPIRLQCVPQIEELQILEHDLEDPLGEEKDMPVPGITHRYPDRVLFYTTHNCPVYCRHCTRKRKVSDPHSMASKDQIEVAFAYIEKH